MSKQTNSKKEQSLFQVKRIKRIIQENDQVIKISNLVPPLIQKSLQFFLIDLLRKSEQVAKDTGMFSITPAVLRYALLHLQSYQFMKDVDQVLETKLTTEGEKSKQTQKNKQEEKGLTKTKKMLKIQEQGYSRKSVKEESS